MDNKKRYLQAQRVVDPSKAKEFKIFKDDDFIKEALDENFYSTKRGKPKMVQRRPHTFATQIKAAEKFKVYERKIEKMKNVQGGGALITGTLFDYRKVMQEIVAGYPQVKQ